MIISSIYCQLAKQIIEACVRNQLDLTREQFYTIVCYNQVIAKFGSMQERKNYGIFLMNHYQNEKDYPNQRFRIHCNKLTKHFFDACEAYDKAYDEKTSFLIAPVA